MLGAMNFWIVIVLYAVCKSSNLNDNVRSQPIKNHIHFIGGAVNESNKQSIRKPNNSSPNKDPKKKWKFSESILQAFELAKIFILSGNKPTNVIINKVLGTNITDKDLSNLLNGPKHVFKDLTDHKKVIGILRKLGKQNNTFSGVYI